MSEYQYYEFQALDRPLTEREMRTLRRYSTRATITATRFVNHYDWGNFKGDVREWMEKYFDAFLYFANWNYHELRLRLPRRSLDVKQVKQYLAGQAATIRTKGDHVILEFHSQEESIDEYDDDGSGWLSSLLPLRADLGAGDLRALYLAWLLCVQLSEIDDGELEPPIPAGLARLSAPLQAFVDFMRIDQDLVTVAAERSERESQGPSGARDVERWVASLPEAEKTALLVRVMGGEGSLVRAELLRRRRPMTTRAVTAEPRTAGALRAEAERRAEDRARRQRPHAPREARTGDVGQGR